MAHARNLAALACTGDYIAISSADIYPAISFIPTVRDIIARTDCDWMHGSKHRAVMTIRKSEFIAAGGYDERFEFYGPEDREMHDRLDRRNLRFAWLPGEQLFVIATPDEEKIRNYRLKISKAEMSSLMRPIYDESTRLGTLVANEGKEWGKWI
jgi:hypothetical protein